MMKQERRATNNASKINEKGVALILTFIFMISLVIITSAYVFMVTYGLRNVNAQINNARALYLAEAGLNKAIWYLTNTAPDSSTDGSWRTTGYPAVPGTGPTDPQQENLGNGTYTMWVETSGSDILVTARGTMNSVVRIIRQTITITQAQWANAFDYAVYANTTTSTLKLKNNVTINGDLYYNYSSGTVDFASGASVSNPYYVYANSITGSGTATQAPSAPDPVPTFPSFTTTTYDAAITTAESSSIGDYTLGGNSNLNLSGGTVYYDKFTVKDNATVTGPGTIVTTKEVKIKNNGNIGPNVTIISKKKITIKDNGIVQSEGVLYSRKNIQLKNNANVTGSLIAQVSNKKVIMGNDTVLTGIIYASKADLKDNAVINGAVVADSYNSNKIKNNVVINYGTNDFPSSRPIGLKGGGITAASVANTWGEI